MSHDLVCVGLVPSFGRTKEPRTIAQTHWAFRIFYVKTGPNHWIGERVCSNIGLEHFRAKWTPVRVKKMRQNKDLERFRESVKFANALGKHDAHSTPLYGQNKVPL